VRRGGFFKPVPDDPVRQIRQRGAEDDRDKTDHKLVAYYRLANRMMEEDPAVQEQIGTMLRKFEAGDSEVISTVRKTAEVMLNGLKETSVLKPGRTIRIR
jgi:arginyl-tRNA synthetase